MEVIIVKGKCRIGKSLSIRYAMIDLIQKGFTVVYNSKRYPNNDSDLLVKRIVKDRTTSKGYVGQITIAGVINNKNVCITTYGDSFIYDIKKAYDKGQELFDDELDLFVCAAHGTGFDKAKKLGYTHSIIKNATLEKKEYDEQNKKYAEEEIVKEIEKVINK